MRPEFFSFFGESFPSYFVLLLTGFLFATAAGMLWVRRIGENPDVIVDLGLGLLILGIVGARILHVFVDGYFWDYVHYCTDPSKVNFRIPKSECLSEYVDGSWDTATGVCHPKYVDCFRWAKFWMGGLTYYGGFIGSVFGGYWLLKRDRFPFWKAADMAGFAAPLGLAFGRMGCLLTGCCFGSPTNRPWGLSFPPHSDASQAQWKAHLLASPYMWSEPIHPTQIYESAASLLICAICMLYVSPRKRYDGQVFVYFLGLYAVARFVIEIFRQDDRGGFFGLSTSQLIGVVMIAVSLVIHVRRMRDVNIKEGGGLEFGF